jgi:hypothetical protein
MAGSRFAASDVTAPPVAPSPARAILKPRRLQVKHALAGPRMVSLLLPVLVALHVAVFAYHSLGVLRFPFDLNYGEGYVLNDAVRLSRGEPLYVDLQQFPMVRSPYPPLFPLLWSAVLPLSGVGLWPGRLLALLATVGLVVLVGWNAWRVRSGVLPVFASAGLVIASPFVYAWGAFARVDTLALLFAAGAVLSAHWLPARRGLTLAALLTLAAIWTKQTTLTAAIAIASAYLLRDIRAGVLFCLLVLIPSAMLLSALEYSTNGEFARHVLVGNAANPVSVPRATIFVVTLLAVHLPAFAGGMWWLTRALRGVPSPVASYLAVSLLGALSAGNEGSSVNYLLEPVMAVALAVPFAWRALGMFGPLSNVVAGLLACLQLIVLLHWPNGFGITYLQEGSLGRTPTADDVAVGRRLDALVQAETGDLISEPAGFAVRNGRPVHVQPIDLRAEQALGRWDSRPLTDALASGGFSLLITAFDFFPADVQRSIDAHFEVVETLRSPVGLTYRVWRFRG